jgi:hypothetical protein
MSRRKKATRQPAPEVISPSPAEVQRMCQEIQSHWSARDRHRRAVTTPSGWTAPTIRFSEMARDVASHWPLSMT